MPTISVSGARIPYRVEGSGPALVLVHGVGPGAAMWDGVLDRFTGHRTVVLPDLAGGDAASDDGASLTVETLAAQVAAVIEDAGTGPADVLGFSLGAPVATAVAGLRPDLVRRLVAVAGVAGPDDEYVRQMVAAWLAVAGDVGAFGRYSTLLAYSREFMNRAGHDVVEQSHGFMTPTPDRLRQVDLVRRVDVRPLLARIAAPTLVIGARHDATLPVENHRAFSTGIAGAEYVELDSGHIVMAERPDEFVEHVEDFLSRP
ncbi:alpha/beta fold hydrolase [Actinomadura sp. LOL_016]|uniref:alpha/beta fold hydrolase n=1 Tax=unclassified Actinomadura TaxID=2626254 RepID=UPI003A80FB22